LVGFNGSGKTTFLRMLMGQVVPDKGEAGKPDYATVGYLPQDGYHSLQISDQASPRKISETGLPHENSFFLLYSVSQTVFQLLDKSPRQ
jgi:ABC-type Mn2+/Zn2+ transport system ATPase subunit